MDLSSVIRCKVLGLKVPQERKTGTTIQDSILSARKLPNIILSIGHNLVEVERTSSKRELVGGKSNLLHVQEIFSFPLYNFT